MQGNLRVAVCFWNRDFHASALRNDSVSKAMDAEQSNWHKGVQRVTVYTIFALILYFMPEFSR
jgi:hypothetical protein